MKMRGPWISVEDKMPPLSTALDMKAVWVWIDDPAFNRPIEGWWYGQHWQVAGSPGRDWVITHWAPMFERPDAYEEHDFVSAEGELYKALASLDEVGMEPVTPVGEWGIKWGSKILRYIGAQEDEKILSDGE